jgi:DNA-binding transcriptional LysR family regulator
MVRDGTLDLAIGTRTAAKLDSALKFRPLFRNDFVVAVRKEHPLCGARSLAELASADWIVPMADGGRLEQVFSAANLPLPRQVVDCGSYSTIVNLLSKTDMLAITSRPLLAASFASGLLQPVPVAERMPSYAVGLYTRMDSPLTSPAAAMVKTITSLARNLARSIS